MNYGCFTLKIKWTILDYLIRFLWSHKHYFMHLKTLYLCNVNRQNECISIVYLGWSSKCSCNNSWHIVFSFRHRVWLARVGNLFFFTLHNNISNHGNKWAFNHYIQNYTDFRSNALYMNSSVFFIKNTPVLHQSLSFVVLNKVIQRLNTLEQLKLCLFLKRNHLHGCSKAKQHLLTSLCFHPMQEISNQGNSAIF